MHFWFSSLVGIIMLRKILSVATICVACYSYAGSNYQNILINAYNTYKTDQSGKNADYIPALAKFNSKYFGIALVTPNGKIYEVGDSKIKFPLESLSKIFTLGLVLQNISDRSVLQKIGANATGLQFNSVMAIENLSDHIGNGLVNAGAMATVSLVSGINYNEKWQKIIDNMNAYAGTTLSVNNEVYNSEASTSYHNQAIATLLYSYGRFYNKPAETVDLYTKACSVDASVVELAKMGAVFANKGKSPITGVQILDAKYVTKVLAEMTTAGLYDSSGDWLYRVGLPAKSGVGGGILAIYPGRFAIAVYSPPLDKFGNSVRGQRVIEYIANKLNANIFN